MRTLSTAVLFLVAAAPAALAQPAQAVKPPVAQYWMSVDTAAGLSMPGMGGIAGALGGMMGGGAAQGGRRMLLQLGSQNAADAPRAEHVIPPGLAMGPSLPLVTPQRAKPEPAQRGDAQPYGEQRPKGRMLIYWGCGEATRAGQPVVIDFSKLAEGQVPPAMTSRRVAVATPPGPGRSRTYGEWPNAEDAKRVPDAASLRGEHVVKGNYSPEIRFALGEGHDFMAPVALAAAARPSGASSVSWNAVPTATGYFATVFGGSGQDEVVFWSSAEVQEMGGSLMHYLPPAEVARLVREKVVLAPSSTECTVPAEVVKRSGGTPMLNFIAYGPEANFAQPPRPADPKLAWQPLWTAKVRFKSTAMLMLGAEAQAERGEPRRRTERAEDAPTNEETAKPAPSTPDPVQEGVRVLRGIFGR